MCLRVPCKTRKADTGHWHMLCHSNTGNLPDAVLSSPGSFSRDRNAVAFMAQGLLDTTPSLLSYFRGSGVDISPQSQDTCLTRHLGSVQPPVLLLATNTAVIWPPKACNSSHCRKQQPLQGFPPYSSQKTGHPSVKIGALCGCATEHATDFPAALHDDC